MGIALQAPVKNSDGLPQVTSLVARLKSPKLVGSLGRSGSPLATKMLEFGEKSTPCFPLEFIQTL